MREAPDGAQRIPQSDHGTRSFRRLAQRLDGVAVPVDSMPDGNESSCLCEQEKENAVNDRQRLLEHVVERNDAHRPSSDCGGQNLVRRGQHAIAEGATHTSGIGLRFRDHGAKRARLVRMRRERVGRGEATACCRRQRFVDDGAELELGESPAIQPLAIDDAQGRPVGEERPFGALCLRLDDCGTPEAVEPFAPGGSDDDNRWTVLAPQCRCRRSCRHQSDVVDNLNLAENGEIQGRQ